MTDGQIESAEWRWVFISSALLILLILIPYLWAYGLAVPNHYFMGILSNPQDGNSYLAKMQQGARGEWFFHLTYTPEDHEPAFLYTFYLFLGHVASWLGLPLILVYHTVRVAGSLFMLLMLYLFAADWTDDVTQRRITWGLAAVCSGFGWLMVITGHLTSDLKVPEAFPLYAAFANAHFPWTIGLIVYVAHALGRAMLSDEQVLPKFHLIPLGLIAATLFTMAVQPFALFPLGVGVGIFLAWRWWRRRRFPKHEFVWASVVLLSALPQLLYGLWITSPTNTIFHAWHMQNQTPSPPPWDYALAFGPFLLLALPAIWKSWPTLGDGEHDGDILLLGWLVSNILLLYAPFSLQRRLTIGLIVPLAVFAGRGLARVILPTVRLRWRPLVVAGVFIFSAPSTVLALVLPLQGALNLDERFYVNLAEEAGLDWLRQHASPEDVVLASPTYSLYIPAQTGARVVYGHAFETVRAEERLSAVLAFYAGEDCDLPVDEGADFVVYGPREEALGGGCIPDEEPAFRSGEVSIYTVGD